MAQRTRFLATILLLFSIVVGQAAAQDEAGAGGTSGLTVLILLTGLGMVVAVGGYMVMREGDNDTEM